MMGMHQTYSSLTFRFSEEIPFLLENEFNYVDINSKLLFCLIRNKEYWILLGILLCIQFYNCIIEFYHRHDLLI